MSIVIKHSQMLKQFYCKQFNGQSAAIVEYTKCFSAEG